MGEGDGLLDLAARLVDNTTGVGVVGQQRADDLADGLPGSNAAARVLQLGEQTVAFLVGLAGESPEVDVDGLAAAQQVGQAGFADRRVGVAFGGCPLEVGDEPALGGQTRGRDRVGLVEPARQPDDGVDEGGGRGRRHPIERGQRHVDGLRPGGQLASASLGALFDRRVLAVVDGQVEVVEMHERVAAVLLELAEADAKRVLERREVGLVVVGRGAGRVQTGEGASDARRRQVLDGTVVFVETGVLPDDGDLQVAHRAHPGVHRADTRVRSPWPLATAAQRAATSPASTSP